MSLTSAFESVPVVLRVATVLLVFLTLAACQPQTDARTEGDPVTEPAEEEGETPDEVAEAESVDEQRDAGSTILEEPDLVQTLEWEFSDVDGYEFVAEVVLEIGSFETYIQESPPGQARLRYEFAHHLTLENATPGRDAPPLWFFAPIYWFDLPASADDGQAVRCISRDDVGDGCLIRLERETGEAWLQPALPVTLGVGDVVSARSSRFVAESQNMQEEVVMDFVERANADPRGALSRSEIVIGGYRAVFGSGDDPLKECDGAIGAQAVDVSLVGMCGF